MNMKKDIFVIAESDRGCITPETYELITFAEELSGGRLPRVIILGRNNEAQAKELAEKTGCNVLSVTGDHLNLYNTQAYCDAILDILPKDNPSWVCLAHTSTGYDLAPRIAVKLTCACITAVEKIRGNILSRSLCQGRFTADIILDTPSAVLTVLPGAFPASVSESNSPGSVRMLQASVPPLKTETLGIKESEHRDSNLNDAEVIVAAGRGVGKKENISLINELAEIFPRSAVGASRSVCDSGWLEYSHQIGTTGQTVSPKLYIACGISGAIQHVSGMKKSQNIVAVNSDPNAAIFRVAHYCIVEDLTSFIPILIDEFKGFSLLRRLF
jgi:electron transfer flavoprotein alpha subunit